MEVSTAVGVLALVAVLVALVLFAALRT